MKRVPYLVDVKPQKRFTYMIHLIGPGERLGRIFLKRASLPGHGRLFQAIFLLDFLPELSEMVIHKMKHHFVSHGIHNTPSAIMDHNTPPHYLKVSHPNFSHKPPSPGHNQANGAAKADVKTAKT